MEHHLTPGRNLILDLLAKSVAKIRAAEVENYVKVEDVKLDGKKGKLKRESMEVPVKKFKAEKKKKKTVDATKEELKIIPKVDAVKTEHAIHMDKKKKSSRKENKVSLEKENGFNEEDKLGRKEKEPKAEELKINGKKGKRKNKENVLVDTTPIPVKIKIEYTEMKTEEIDVESYVKPEIIKLTSSSSSNILKNENNKDNIKVNDNLDVKSKERSDVFEQTIKVMDVKKMEPVKKSLKKECIRLELEDNKDLISKDKSKFLTEVHQRENSKKHKTVIRPPGLSSKRFSPEEDQTILLAIKKFGDKIDIAQLAEDLQRTVESIRHEARKLKDGKVKKKLARKYTLTEDLLILDAVLEISGEDSLEVMNLTQSGWKEIEAQIGKGSDSIRLRWVGKLRLWILQHFAGTLNLDIRRPLANYLAANFADIISVDWHSLVTKPQFAGHTPASLKYYFNSYLVRSAKIKNLKHDGEDISLVMLAEFANTKYAEGGRKVLDKDLKRQQEIIAYFESYVKTKGIENFL